MDHIVYTCDDFVIAFKPHNIPTVPLKDQNCPTLLSIVCEKYPEIMSVKGKNPWEGGAIHRLDTLTEGLVIFARKQHFYDYIMCLQQEDKIVKTYRAITEKSDNFIDESISSYFRAFGKGRKMVKVEKDVNKADSVKLYTTKIRTIENKDSYTVVECSITQGFRHQIRAHLASIGMPIKGDILYNPKAENEDLKLSCIGFCFPLENSEIFTYTLQ